jgi:voltage-gated potassium channel Kch
MHTARIPPVEPTPATIAAVLATHAGHIFPRFLFTITHLVVRKIRPRKISAYVIAAEFWQTPRWSGYVLQ